MGTLQKEIKQKRPFRSARHEGALALLKTSESVRRFFEQAVQKEGITLQQYNVLRILRGALPDALPVLEIATRMIEATPGITRLLDRLETKGFVKRSRCKEDRRQVLCSITDKGQALLKIANESILQLEEEPLRPLSESEAQLLIDLLDRVRASLESDK